MQYSGQNSIGYVHRHKPIGINHSGKLQEDVSIGICCYILTQHTKANAYIEFLICVIHPQGFMPTELWQPKYLVVFSPLRAGFIFIPQLEKKLTFNPW